MVEVADEDGGDIYRRVHFRRRATLMLSGRMHGVMRWLLAQNRRCHSCSLLANCSGQLRLQVYTLSDSDVTFLHQAVNKFLPFLLTEP